MTMTATITEEGAEEGVGVDGVSGVSLEPEELLEGPLHREGPL